MELSLERSECALDKPPTNWQKPCLNQVGLGLGVGGAERWGRHEGGSQAAVSRTDDSPAPPAPFEHRVVSVRETSTSAGYTVYQHEVLGG